VRGNLLPAAFALAGASFFTLVAAFPGLLGTLSGQVQPPHYCCDPPPVYPPERTIGGAGNFTLQDRGLGTSYTLWVMKMKRWCTQMAVIWKSY